MQTVIIVKHKYSQERRQARHNTRCEFENQKHWVAKSINIETNAAALLEPVHLQCNNASKLAPFKKHLVFQHRSKFD